MRKKRIRKEVHVLDPKYKDPAVGKFINVIMEKGKKIKAQKIVYGAIDSLNEKGEESGHEVFKKAIQNTSPLVEVRGRRVGSTIYRIPMEVRPERKLALALRWIKKASLVGSGKSTVDKLTVELWDAANNQGSSVKKKEEMHKMAEANKAFSHFRF